MGLDDLPTRPPSEENDVDPDGGPDLLVAMDISLSDEQPRAMLNDVKSVTDLIVPMFLGF